MSSIWLCSLRAAEPGAASKKLSKSKDSAMTASTSSPTSFLIVFAPSDKEQAMQSPTFAGTHHSRIGGLCWLFAGAIISTLLASGTAHATGTGMPWEAPLQKILDSVQGPVAKIVAVIIIVITGLTLAFGESSGGFRHLIQIVFGLSIAFAASSFFLSFFSFGGGALI